MRRAESMNTGFLRRITQGGALSLVKLLTGLVKIKVLAMVLGVGGVGLLSLGLQFQGTAVALVSMSMSVGVINLGRPYWVAKDVDSTGAVLGTALVMVGLSSLVFLFGMLMLTVFLDIAPGSMAGLGYTGLWPLALASVVVSFANVMWEGLSFLVDRFDVYVRSNMIAAVGDVILFCMGAWLFGLPGAFVASLLGSLSLFASYALLSRRAPSTRRILASLSVDRMYIAPLLSYGMLMLGTTTVGQVCLFGSRAYLTATAGEEANGYLQVVTALAAYLLPFVMTGVWGHLHANAAASGDNEEMRDELRRTVVSSMRLGAAGCITVVVGAPLLVKMVYTRDFLSAQQMIPVYFIGEIVYVFLSVLSAYLLAVGQKRVYLIGYSVYHILLLTGVVLLTSSIGVWGYVVSHIIGAVVVGLLAVAYTLDSGMLDAGTLRMTGCCIIAVVACCVMDSQEIVLPIPGLVLRATWILGPVLVLAIIAPMLRHSLKRLLSVVAAS